MTHTEKYQRRRLLLARIVARIEAMALDELERVYAGLDERKEGEG